MPLFCRDCRYCSPEAAPLNAFITDPLQRLENACCVHPEARVIDDGAYQVFLVTGQRADADPVYKQCSVMRAFDCGADATLFAAKSADGENKPDAE